MWRADHISQVTWRTCGLEGVCPSESLEALNLKPYSPPQVDRIWLCVYYNKIPIYPIFYLLKGDYKSRGF